MTIYYSPSERGFYDSEIHRVIPDDKIEVTEELRAALLDAQVNGDEIRPGTDGVPIATPRVASFEERAELIRQAVQGTLDSVARSLGYDDIRTAVTYADEPAVPSFQAEGKALRAWRSLCWAHCYRLMAEVQAGADEPSVETVISGLPAPDLPL